MRSLGIMKVSLVGLIAGCLLSATANSTTLELLPSDTIVQIGDTFMVSVAVSGFAPGLSPPIGDFNIFIRFDPATLYSNIQSLPADAVFSAYLGSPGYETTAAWGAVMATGQANVHEISTLNSGNLSSLQQSDLFPLATLFFTATAPGETSISFDSVSVGGAGLWSNNAYQGLGPRLEVLTGSTAKINVIPIPTTLALFSLGLVGLSLFKNRQSQAIRIS